MRIEYEDDSVIVVWKEAGLPVQTARTSGLDAVSILKNHINKENAVKTGPDNNISENIKGQHDINAHRDAGRLRAASVPGEAAAQYGRYRMKPATLQRCAQPYLGIVHRLDQPVEGLLVFAKTPKAAASLSAQAAKYSDNGNAVLPHSKVSHEKGKASGSAKKSGAEVKNHYVMNKTYRALVRLRPESYPLAVEGMKRDVTLTDWLIRDGAANISVIADPEEKGAKKAVLSFRTLQLKGSRAYLEIHLYTGRHHQIRAQLANAGMPIEGDRKYGGVCADDGRKYAGVYVDDSRSTMPEGRKVQDANGNNSAEGRSAKPEGSSAQGADGNTAAEGRGVLDTGGNKSTGLRGYGRLCLCAADLEFTHPVSGKRMRFHAEPTFELR